MNKNTETRIIGLVPVGTTVTIAHDGHPHNGATVVVTGDNGATGGVAGGGVVWVTYPGDDGPYGISRYTRVTIQSA